MVRMTSYGADAWKRLGEAIRRRRAMLGMTQEDLADAADLSPGTVRNIEQGRRPRELSLPKINAALGWTDDSYVRVLEGGTPEVADLPAQRPDQFKLDRPERISDAEWAELQAELAREAEKFLRWRDR